MQLNQKIEIHTVSDYPVINLHLELSSKCTLHCPRCPRTEKKGKYKVTEHTLEFVQSVLTAELLNSTPNITLCGGQGDPIYCRDFIEIIKYIKSVNHKIQLTIITNGSYKNRDWWVEVANILNQYDIIIFSIDGWDNASNNLYRVNSDFDSIMLGLDTLRKTNSNLNIIWSTILFKFNQHNIKDICDLAKSKGVNSFNLVRSTLFGSNIPSYLDKDGYDSLEPTVISKWDYHELEAGVQLNPVNTLHNGTTVKIRAQANLTKELYIDSPVIPLCVAGDRSLYIDAEGILYPCSWISHPFGIRVSKTRDKTILWNKSLFVEHKSNFDLNLHTMSEIISSTLWKNLMSSWKDSSKMFVECENKCNNKASVNRITNRTTNVNNKMSYDDFVKSLESGLDGKASDC